MINADNRCGQCRFLNAQTCNHTSLMSAQIITFPRAPVRVPMWRVGDYVAIDAPGCVAKGGTIVHVIGRTATVETAKGGPRVVVDLRDCEVAR